MKAARGGGVQLLSEPFKREQLARKVADVLTGKDPKKGNVVALTSHRNS